ncbi:hypothetical protein ACFSKY_18250 [Azotobacter chroococcum]|uniref:Uncharacterized protein n=1 Tax=Azotobacter chroococcum TaxID=353 RepID=A0A4R1PQB8_9GAMM|nr:hypothetical protein [Azotobacter chroococcum]TBV94614.1 hypothetical protein E0E53_14215 [Azotobacter chroococcum]TCL33720.1 hypothetical protein EV691_10389 [Azotobacter chroococcum]
MNPAAASVTPTNTRLCKHCLTPFEFKRKTAEFCCDTCRKAYKRQQQRSIKKKRLYRAESSPFFTFLAQECKRAGTIQVLQGHTLESLLELHEVYALRLRGNLLGSVNKYSVCHIFPVSHPTHIGMLHAGNLVVGLKEHNQNHGNKLLGNAGMSIPRVRLLPKWRVDEEEPIKTIADRIVEYLGGELVAQLAVKAKLQPSRRQVLTMWLQSCPDERIPPQEKLAEMTTQQLSQLQSQIKDGKESGFDISSRAACIEPEDMALRELRRLARYRPELLKLEEVFAGYAAEVIAYVNRLGGYPHIPKELRQLQFEVLHGACVHDFLRELERIRDAEREAFKPKVWSAAEMEEFDRSLPF